MRSSDNGSVFDGDNCICICPRYIRSYLSAPLWYGLLSAITHSQDDLASRPGHWRPLHSGQSSRKQVAPRPALAPIPSLPVDSVADSYQDLPAKVCASTFSVSVVFVLTAAVSVPETFDPRQDRPDTMSRQPHRPGDLRVPPSDRTRPANGQRRL